MEDIKKFLSKRIQHANKRVDIIKSHQGEEPSKKYNYYGGHALGYWEGKLSAYSRILDEIEEAEMAE